MASWGETLTAVQIVQHAESNGQVIRTSPDGKEAVEYAAVTLAGDPTSTQWVRLFETSDEAHAVEPTAVVNSVKLAQPDVVLIDESESRWDELREDDE